MSGINTLVNWESLHWESDVRIMTGFIVLLYVLAFGFRYFRKANADREQLELKVLEYRIKEAKEENKVKKNIRLVSIVQEFLQFTAASPIISVVTWVEPQPKSVQSNLQILALELVGYGSVAMFWILSLLIVFTWAIDWFYNSRFFRSSPEAVRRVVFDTRELLELVMLDIAFIPTLQFCLQTVTCFEDKRGAIVMEMFDKWECGSAEHLLHMVVGCLIFIIAYMLSLRSTSQRDTVEADEVYLPRFQVVFAACKTLLTAIKVLYLSRGSVITLLVQYIMSTLLTVIFVVALVGNMWYQPSVGGNEYINHVRSATFAWAS
eukprot:GFYU01050140.1.p1 GENE.GFYU01050140.1~~GFYU01050140.1.p1  ORF type:complete len:320 (-),score=93.12 GFYU01050140.1:17-976(-)